MTRAALLALTLFAVAVKAAEIEVPADEPLATEIDSAMAKSGDHILVLPSGLFLNDKGVQKLNLKLDELQRENASLQAQNKVLNNSGNFNLRSAVICVVVGLAVGAAVPIYLQSRTPR